MDKACETSYDMWAEHKRVHDAAYKEMVSGEEHKRRTLRAVKQLVIDAIDDAFAGVNKTPSCRVNDIAYCAALNILNTVEKNGNDS